jgi:hypothetical protein
MHSDEISQEKMPIMILRIVRTDVCQVAGAVTPYIFESTKNEAAIGMAPKTGNATFNGMR